MENIITSKDNPIIKLYQKLSSSKKERVQYGLFVLEGLRITEDAIREESGLSHILITEQAYDKYGEKLFQADLRDTRVIVISNELGNKIASTGTPQGVFAICRIPAKKQTMHSDWTELYSRVAVIFTARRLSARQWDRFSGSI